MRDSDAVHRNLSAFHISALSLGGGFRLCSTSNGAERSEAAVASPRRGRALKGVAQTGPKYV
jgi:hypothetical protein